MLGLLLIGAGAVDDPTLDEISGMAATDEGVMVVEDSGNPSTVTLLSLSGETIRSWPLDVALVDAEAMARTADNRLVIADTGSARRDGQPNTLFIVDVTEDRASSVSTITIDPAMALPDAEALLTDAGQAVLIERTLTGCARTLIVEFEAATSDTGPCIDVRRHLGWRAAVDPAVVTDAAASADLVVLRTPIHVLLWHRDGDTTNQSVASVLQSVPDTIVRSPFELQGEAVAISPDGRQILTISEGPNPSINAIDVPKAPSDLPRVSLPARDWFEHLRPMLTILFEVLVRPTVS